MIASNWNNLPSDANSGQIYRMHDGPDDQQCKHCVSLSLSITITLSRELTHRHLIWRMRQKRVNRNNKNYSRCQRKRTAKKKKPKQIAETSYFRSAHAEYTRNLFPHIFA